MSDTFNNRSGGTPGGVKKPNESRLTPSSEITKGNIKEMYTPVIVKGVIMRVYFSNEEGNTTNDLADLNPTNLQSQVLVGDGYQKEALAGSGGNRQGWAIEADVKVILGVSGIVDSGSIIPRAKFCIPFGGIKNYGYVVPTGTSNIGYGGYTGKENGDHCLIQYIGGMNGNPVITHIFPHERNRGDSPGTLKMGTAYARINGSKFNVNSSGDLEVDTRNADEIYTTNSQDGITTITRPSGSSGRIVVMSRSNITLHAGIARQGENAESLPRGNFNIISGKDLKLKSEKKDVYINAIEEDKLVNIQNERGSLRRVAREHDKIEITRGDSGDLFSYLQMLHRTLESLAGAFSVSTDPAGQVAGILIDSFISVFDAPTSQEGVIIEGSDYCKIAGVGGAADIDGDPSGIDNDTGKSLEALQTECIVKAVTGEVFNLLMPDPRPEIITTMAQGLKSLELSLEVLNPPLAAVVKNATPIILNHLNMVLQGDILSLAAAPGNLADVTMSTLSEELNPLLDFDKAIEILIIVKADGAEGLTSDEDEFYTTSLLCEDPDTGAPYTKENLNAYPSDQDPLNQPDGEGDFANPNSLYAQKDAIGVALASPDGVVGKIATLALDDFFPAAATAVEIGELSEAIGTYADEDPPNIAGIKNALKNSTLIGPVASILESADKCIDNALTAAEDAAEEVP